MQESIVIVGPILVGIIWTCCYCLRNRLFGVETPSRRRSAQRYPRKRKRKKKPVVPPDPYPRRLDFAEDPYTPTEERQKRTAKGEWVRSHGERIIADTLREMGIHYEYERPWCGNSWHDTRMPDFTIYHKGRVFLWEHQGMMSDADYRKRHENQRDWYERNGYTLIESEDPPGRGVYISEEEVREIVRVYIFQSSGI